MTGADYASDRFFGMVNEEFHWLTKGELWIDSGYGADRLVALAATVTAMAVQAAELTDSPAGLPEPMVARRVARALVVLFGDDEEGE